MESKSVRPKKSFSQWENYQECPARWKFQSVLKLPRTPAGPAAARGSEMHGRCEKYIKGEIGWFPAKYGEPSMRFGDKKCAVIHEDYKEVLDSFRDHDNGARHCEFRMGVDAEGFLCGFTSEHARAVVVLDAVRAKEGLVHIGEWKSGKPKPTHKDQRSIYSWFGIRGWLADRVETTTYYLEHSSGLSDFKPQRFVAEEKHLDKLKTIWMSRFDQMDEDEICGPRPGFYCTWCDYSRLKGGPCKVG